MLNRTFCETWYLQLHHSRLLSLNTYHSQVSLSRTLSVINYRYSNIVNKITFVINGNDVINIFAISTHRATVHVHYYTRINTSLFRMLTTIVTI